MDDRDYQLMVDLYEIRNITKVAQKQFLSQPAITKRIKRVETELGCRLVERTKKGVEFTSIGESFIPYCREMLRLNFEMRNCVNSSLGVVGGSLNVCASHNYCHYRLLDPLNEYHRNYPRVDISVASGKSKHLYHQLLQNKNNVSILRGEFKWGEGKILLSQEPMCLICSKDNAGRPLNDYPYISHNADTFELEKMSRWAEEQNISLLGNNLWIDEINICREFVRHGNGWSILPRICLDNFDGEIVPLHFADGTAFTRSTYAMFWNAYGNLKQVRLFLEIVAEAEKKRLESYC